MFEDDYPLNLNGDFELDFYGDNLKPDCIFCLDKRNYYVYFNINSLKNILDEKLTKIEKDFPQNYEDLKEPLKNYMKTFQKNIYKEDTGILNSISLTIKFLFGKESFNKEIRERAKYIAFLLSQIDGYSRQKETTTIAMIDSLHFNMKFYSYNEIDTIIKEIGDINIKRSTIEEINDSLKILEENYFNISNKINNNYNENDKIILKSLLANEINKKLMKIEDPSPPKETDAYKKMRFFRNKINVDILQNINTEKYNNIFFDEEFEFKIIKDTRNEKCIILNGEIYMNKFKNKLNENFEVLRDHLLKFNIDETEGLEIKPENKMDFIRRYMSKVDHLADLDKKIQHDINDLNRKKFNQKIKSINKSVDIYKNIQNKDAKNAIEGIGEIGDNFYIINDYNIDKKLLEKTSYIINHNKNEIIKLIKEYELIEQIKKKMKQYNIKNINGLLIKRKINNPKEPLTDIYSVEIIY